MDDVDIYGDLPEFDLGTEITKLQGKIKELEETIEKLSANLDEQKSVINELNKAKEVLATNVSELYKTAKREIDRKDALIAELRGKLETLERDAIQGGGFKKRARDIGFETSIQKKPKLGDEKNILPRDENFVNRNKYSNRRESERPNNFKVDHRHQSQSNDRRRSRSRSRDRKNDRHKESKNSNRSREHQKRKHSNSHTERNSIYNNDPPKKIEVSNETERKISLDRQRNDLSDGEIVSEDEKKVTKTQDNTKSNLNKEVDNKVKTSDKEVKSKDSQSRRSTSLKESTSGVKKSNINNQGKYKEKIHKFDIALNSKKEIDEKPKKHSSPTVRSSEFNIHTENKEEKESTDSIKTSEPSIQENDKEKRIDISDKPLNAKKEVDVKPKRHSSSNSSELNILAEKECKSQSKLSTETGSKKDEKSDKKRILKENKDLTLKENNHSSKIKTISHKDEKRSRSKDSEKFEGKKEDGKLKSKEKKSDSKLADKNCVTDNPKKSRSLKEDQKNTPTKATEPDDVKQKSPFDENINKSNIIDPRTENIDPVNETNCELNQNIERTKETTISLETDTISKESESYLANKSGIIIQEVLVIKESSHISKSEKAVPVDSESSQKNVGKESNDFKGGSSVSFLENVTENRNRNKSSSHCIAYDIDDSTFVDQDQVRLQKLSSFIKNIIECPANSVKSINNDSSKTYSSESHIRQSETLQDEKVNEENHQIKVDDTPEIDVEVSNKTDNTTTEEVSMEIEPAYPLEQPSTNLNNSNEKGESTVSKKSSDQKIETLGDSQTMHEKDTEVKKYVRRASKRILNIERITAERNKSKNKKSPEKVALDSVIDDKPFGDSQNLPHNITNDNDQRLEISSMDVAIDLSEKIKQVVSQQTQKECNSKEDIFKSPEQTHIVKCKKSPIKKVRKNFENVLNEDGKLEENFPELHLTHDGEIPVLHLEDDHFKNVPGGLAPDTNIMNLMDAMNVTASALECDISKCKNSSDENIATKSSLDATKENSNDSVSFANCLAKVTSTPNHSITSVKETTTDKSQETDDTLSESLNKNSGLTASATAPLKRRRRRVVMSFVED